MANIDQSQKKIPQLRRDLEIYQGPEDSDGSSTYSLYDPIRHAYFKLNWAEAMIIRTLKPGMSLKKLVERVNNTTTLQVSEQDVMLFFQQLETQGLLESRRDIKKLEAEEERGQMNWFKWFILHYLFLKIPLVNPNRFLTKTLPWAMPFLSPTAFLVYCLISLWGGLILLTRWSDFLYTFTYFFNFKGFLFYSLAIVCTKVLHELAHAYTAKKYGVNVPSMGIALLVLWPVMFTDATDAWRLHDRNKRLAISAAGIITELVLAGLATIGWAFTDSGILNSIFFVIASANWISTLIINLNPALRFDGYYILMDLLGVENLQSRAFNLARRECYRFFAGIILPNPEPKLPENTQKIMVVYAIYTWIYRIFLYTAIAMFVYFKFTKILGIFLFLLEIGIFFIWPVVHEARFLHRIGPHIQWNRRLKITLTVLTLLVAWFVLPWPHVIRAPGVTVAVENQIVYSLNKGKISEIFIKRGDSVKNGQPLLLMESHVLDNQIKLLTKEKAILEKKLFIIQESKEMLSMYLETQAKLTQAEAELKALLEQRQQNEVVATVDGNVYEWDEFLHTGQYVEENQKLGQIASINTFNVICFVQDEDIGVLKLGSKVEFRSNRTYDKFQGTITRIPPVRAQILQYPQLSSAYGGDLPVLGTGKAPMTLIESFYPVLVSLESKDSLGIGETGEVNYYGPWRSYLMSIIKYVTNVIIKESGF